MSQRTTELLLKAIRQLDPEERDELLAGVLADRLQTFGLRGRGPVLGPPASVAGDPRSRHRSAWGWPTLDELTVTELSSDADAELRVLPVRLPTSDHDRLRTFSRENGFSMAVIIRTLVERFLDERAPLPPDPDRSTD